MITKFKIKTKSGFIALMSAIIISVVLLLLATNLSFTSFYGRSNILDGELKERSSALAEACVDTALLRLTIDPTYPHPKPDAITVDGDTCIIDSISLGTIYIHTDYKKYVTNLEIDYNSSIEVTRWEEVL